MPIALTRAVSPHIGRCELTHLARTPIDAVRARLQHEAYEDLLQALGCEVLRLPETPDLPDGVFVEDTAVVLDEIAILARPGADSRRPETATVEPVLAKLRRLVAIENPGRLDGGDVLRVGRRLFVGRSARTNDRAIAQLGRVLAPVGYTVEAVGVHACLHLKSAVTAVNDQTLLLNPAWVDARLFSDYELVHVHPSEPFAANVLRIDDLAVMPDGFPETRHRLETRGIEVRTVDVSELARAEGGVTCCSLILESNVPPTH